MIGVRMVSVLEHADSPASLRDMSIVEWYYVGALVDVHAQPLMVTHEIGEV